MSNRAAVTVRFNLDEQHDLRTLVDFWKMGDEKKVLKFAFAQLVQSTAQLNKKLLEEEATKKEEVSSQPTSSQDSSPSPQPSTEAPATANP